MSTLSISFGAKSKMALKSHGKTNCEHFTGMKSSFLSTITIGLHMTFTFTKYFKKLCFCLSSIPDNIVVPLKTNATNYFKRQIQPNSHWAGSAKKLQISIFRISKKFLIHFKIGNIPLGKPPSITK